MPLTSKIHFFFCLWLAIIYPALTPVRPLAFSARGAAQASTALAAGRKSYEAHCAVCHGLDGRGGEHAPGIANSKDVQERSEEALEKIVRQGIPAAGMPAFGSLPDAEIVSVVKYVRSLSGAATVEAVKGDPERGDGLFFGKGSAAPAT